MLSFFGFRFKPKDLDTEVQNEMQKVITATENFGKAGKGEAGEGDTGSTPAAPGPAPSSLTHLGGMRNLSSPKTFIQTPTIAQSYLKFKIENLKN